MPMECMKYNKNQTLHHGNLAVHARIELNRAKRPDPDDGRVGLHGSLHGVMLTDGGT